MGTETNNAFPAPAWWDNCRQALQSGATQALILHLNTRDYAVPGRPLTAFLSKVLAGRDVVAVYNRSTGITFPLPSMEQRARELLNLTAEAAPSAPGGLDLAALMGAPAGQAGPPELPRRPAEALALLEKLLAAPARTTVIIEYAETLLPATDLAMMGPDDRTALVTLMRWGTDAAIQAAGNFAFLLVKNLADLHADLRAGSTGFYAVEVPLPDRAARLAFVEWYLATRPVESDLTPAELANLTAGLSLIHIENLLLQADLTGRLTRDLVRRHKAALIEMEYAGLLEMLEPSYGFEAIGGMQKLKEWSVREVIQPAREGRFSDMPQGVLLVGPPGTGKSYVVKALAYELGFNAVALSMEKILGGIVGTSEKNMARALSVVASLAPTLCLTGDAMVQMADGRLIAIADLYNAGRGGDVSGLDPQTLKLQNAAIMAMQRLPAPRTLREVVTKWGNRLTGTLDHKLLVNRQGAVAWVPLGELRLGDYAAAPRTLANAALVPSFAQMLPPDITYLYDEALVEQAKQRYAAIGKIARFARERGLSTAALYSFKSRGTGLKLALGTHLGVPVEQAVALSTHRQSGSSNRANFGYASREDVLQDLCYLTGLVKSDGHLARDGCTVSFVNKDATLHDRFATIGYRLGQPTVGRTNLAPHRVQTSYFSSKTIHTILTWLWDHLTLLHSDLIAAFLKGYQDGDGSCVGRCIRLCTTKAWKADRLQTACLMLDLLTYRESKSPKLYYQGLIVPPASHLKHQQLVGFRQVRRRERLATMEPAQWRTERLDVVPAAKPLATAYAQARLHGARTRAFAPLTNSLVSDIMHTKAPARYVLAHVTARLAEFGADVGPLTILAQSDVVWQQITEINDLVDHGHEYVYDLTVDETHSFVANGLVNHNCFIDELDQSDVAARGNNSGNPVAKNLFSQLLRFLGDPANRGQVLFFAASNRPDLMDDAMLRFGRMDAIIPVLLPDESERRAIAEAQARTQGVAITDAALALIAANSERYSAADLAAVITKARKLARPTDPDQVPTIQPAHAEYALRTLRPNTTKTADRATLLAVQACNDTDLLPDQYAALLDDRSALDQQIAATRPTEPGPRGRREL